MMQWDGIVPMSKIECYCGGHLWFLYRDDNDLLDINCPICKSTFHQISNWEINNKYIEWYMEQQI